MIFLNNKVKSLLFALVILSIVISSSCVFASDDFNQTNDVVGDDNTGYVISASGEIFISPDGTGSGISADSPTNWYNAYSSANNGDTIVFLGGNYIWNSMQSISKSITLKGYGDSESIIDALNQNGFFRTTAGSTVQLINLTFFDAETGDTGSGGIVNNGNLIVNHCYFAENTGWGTEGGAIHNSGTCNVYDSTFFSNTAKKGGSFYGEERSILNVYNSTFIKGSSKEGNCFNIKEATANIYDCQFINCSAKSGIIHTKKGTVNIYNSNFTNSRAVDYAACVDVDKESYVLIDNCIFDKCTSVGGVIWNTDGKKIGTGNGGAVYVEKGGSLTIKNSLFTNCSAKADGGALYIESRGDALVDNCTFINNTASQGRHIFIEGSIPTIKDCTFEVNDTLTALQSGSDENVNIYVDVGTNFMQYNIPVKMSGNEVGVVNKENSVITLSGLAAGEYEVILDANDKVSTNKYIFNQESVSFKVGNGTSSENQTGDDNQTSDDNKTDVNVNVTLTAPEVELYYKNGTRFYAYLFDSESNPIRDKEVVITVNGVDNKRVTDGNGAASIAINLEPGAYDVSVKCENLSVMSKITVLSTIAARDIVKVYKNGTQFYANFTDGNGNPLAKKTVMFNINGVFYYRNTTEDGVARLNINLMAGTYIITSTNLENGENSANQIVVVSKIIENHDLIKFYRNDSQYVVKILNDDGSVAGAGKTVEFNINGVFYKRVTNETGHAKLNVNLEPGDYIITADCDGCMASNNITVKPILFADDIEKVFGSSDQFNVQLLDGQGNPFAEQSITFNINGVFYNRTTDSAGIAHLNINLQAGVYIITSSYNGCNIANKVTVTSE